MSATQTLNSFGFTSSTFENLPEHGPVLDGRVAEYATSLEAIEGKRTELESSGRYSRQGVADEMERLVTPLLDKINKSDAQIASFLDVQERAVGFNVNVAPKKLDPADARELRTAFAAVLATRSKTPDGLELQASFDAIENASDAENLLIEFARKGDAGAVSAFVGVDQLILQAQGIRQEAVDAAVRIIFEKNNPAGAARLANVQRVRQSIAYNRNVFERNVTALVQQYR